LLIDECGDDDILIKVLEAMMDGAEKSAEIAEATGIPIKDVYNATKRLDRKLEKSAGALPVNRTRRSPEGKSYERK